MRVVVPQPTQVHQRPRLHASTSPFWTVVQIDFVCLSTNRLLNPMQIDIRTKSSQVCKKSRGRLGDTKDPNLDRNKIQLDNHRTESSVLFETLPMDGWLAHRSRPLLSQEIKC